MADFLVSDAFNLAPFNQVLALSLPKYYYNVGLASQSSNTVTCNDATFTSAMIGGQIVFATTPAATNSDAVPQIATITAVPSSTTLTVDVSQTFTNPVNYVIWYGGVSANSTGTLYAASAIITNLQTNGDLQAGSSGDAGKLISYPATAAKGSLQVVAVANTGDTVTTISNAAMGQATTVSIPDPATATANFVVRPTALVNGNLVKASGTAGLIVDAGAKIIANTTAAYAGGGTSNAFTATGLTVAAKGTAVIRASTNSVSITKALPGTDTLTITFSADPGANTTVDYIYVTAAQS